MADKKISALTAATVPLTGTEVLPVVQGGLTVKVSAADITAGRAVSALSQTLSGGDLTFSSTAQRITGNTSDATHGNRLLFQNSVVNGNTFVGAIPNGTSQVSGLNFYNNSNPTNSSYTTLRVTSTETQLQSTILGAGTYLPLAVYVNGAKKWTFDTTGNLAVATAGNGIDFSANSGAAGMTSETLTWYEEGDWTPNQGAGLTVVGAFSSSGKYTRIGRQVTVTGQVNGATSVLVSASGVISTNLPFTSGVNTLGIATNSALSVVGGVFVSSGTTNLSATVAIGATPTIYFQVTYFV